MSTEGSGFGPLWSPQNATALDRGAIYRDAENTTHTAAIDVGANNTLAIVTDTAETAVYHARPAFERFHALTEEIAALQAHLPDDQYTSRQIQRLFDERSRRRDHSCDAAVKHAAEWLLARNVATVSVGELTGVLDTHWSTTVNEKTHRSGRTLDRIQLTFEDVGISVSQVSEVDSSSDCPACGGADISRDGDAFRCRECGLDAHSDVTGAWNIVQSAVGPMARPAALSAGRDRDASLGHEGAYWQWDGHEWTPAGFGERSSQVTNPASANPHVHSRGNQLAG